MTAAPLTRNITAAFRAASDEDRAKGFDWFDRARTLAELLAESITDPDRYFEDGEDFVPESAVRQAAGVIAALSPVTPWPRNVQLAWKAYELRHLTREEFCRQMPTMGRSAGWAWDILQGQRPEDVLSGAKVRTFYFTIADPSDPRSVVIDRHAIDVAYGAVLGDAARGRAVKRKGAYDALSELYRKAARIISRERDETWTPAQVQAACWEYWRRERAAAYHPDHKVTAEA